MSDRALFATIAQGSTDGALWRLFVTRFSKLCYHAIHRVFVKYPHFTPADVDEAFQRLFIHMLEGDRALLKRYRGENGCSEATYLGHLAAYEALEYARSREQRGRSRETLGLKFEPSRTTEERHSDAEIITADVLIIKSHEARVVQRCLEHLSSADRLLYQLHYVDDLTLAEISRVLGKGESAIHTQHFRLKDRLRKLLLELPEARSLLLEMGHEAHPS